MNEEWQEQLMEDYSNGLLTEEEMRNRIELARSQNAAIPSYIERVLDEGEQAA